ncbi:hypothetical protein OBBRIDRAFT_421667 [Obba rivulosa]|uniref:Uncharacterized protein n=1 Tax=Obba rivulosa TaxID=1052685 RepID=A0A8E2B5R8_9APHY|nr:hypothetical protein OBBRIDRAFT_421667 [Obba rivulosa]
MRRRFSRLRTSRGVFTHIYAFCPLECFAGSCEGDSLLGQALTILLFAYWAAFSSVRVYAISGGNRWIPILIFGLSLVPAGTNLYGSFIAEYYEIEVIPILGLECVNGKRISEATSASYNRHSGVRNWF